LKKKKINNLPLITMATLLTYCLKLSISLALVSIFYQLVLRKLTFYNWNRYYLLGYGLLSFLVATLNVSPVLRHNEITNITFVQWIPVLNSDEMTRSAVEGEGSLTTASILSLLLITGVIILFVRLLMQLLSFRRMIRNAEFICAEGMKFYQVNEAIIPFSFGKSIFINRKLHSERELKEIIRHEFVHVKQQHSIDIVVAEIICLLNWYNPFAWLLKASIRQNLEFIADDRVLQNGVNKKEYQYLLLKVIGNNQFSIAPKFNFSSLKKRIAMMNKLRSARLNLVRFLFVLPLVVALLLAFRDKESQAATKSKHIFHNPAGLSAPAEEVTDTVPRQEISSKQKKGSSISIDCEINNDRAVIRLKDGTTEEYDLNNKEQRRNFEEKYGKIINISAPNVAVSAVPVITLDGVTTAISPVTVVTTSSTSKGIGMGHGNGSGNANGNGNGNGNGNNDGTTVSSNAVVAITSNVSTSPTIVSAATASGGGTTVIAPVAVSVGEGVTVTADDADAMTGHEEVLLTITKKTTRQQLDEFKKQMKEKGFELNFKEIHYDDNGQLASIGGTMESKDKACSFAATAFSKIIISIVGDGDRSYFKVDEKRPVKKVI